jgi:hypothetical protein
LKLTLMLLFTALELDSMRRRLSDINRANEQLKNDLQYMDKKTDDEIQKLQKEFDDVCKRYVWKIYNI